MTTTTPVSSRAVEQRQVRELPEDPPFAWTGCKPERSLLYPDLYVTIAWGENGTTTAYLNAHGEPVDPPLGTPER